MLVAGNSLLDSRVYLIIEGLPIYVGMYDNYILYQSILCNRESGQLKLIDCIKPLKIL